MTDDNPQGTNLGPERASSNPKDLRSLCLVSLDVVEDARQQLPLHERQGIGVEMSRVGLERDIEEPS
jgi:hypothetical protein